MQLQLSDPFAAFIGCVVVRALWIHIDRHPDVALPLTLLGYLYEFIGRLLFTIVDVFSIIGQLSLIDKQLLLDAFEVSSILDLLYRAHESIINQSAQVRPRIALRKTGDGFEVFLS